MSKIKGIYAASMSIFNKNLSLNIEKTLAHAEKIIDQGCHGVAIFGSTGQSQLISVSEKIKFLSELSKNEYCKNFIIRTLLHQQSIMGLLYGVTYVVQIIWGCLFVSFISKGWKII